MSKARDLANAGTALGAVTATELGYVDGVTSAIQTQIDAKTAKSTLTTTGDIYYASTANTPARLGIGSTGNVLTVASGIPSWAAPAGGAGNMAQIATGTLSGSSVVISGLSSYTDIFVVMHSVTNNTANGYVVLRLNATTSNHDSYGLGNQISVQTPDNIITTNNSTFDLHKNVNNRVNNSNVFAVKLTNCKNPGFTDVDSIATYINIPDEVKSYTHIKGIFTKSEAVSSITLLNSGGTWSGGTYIVWGA